MGIKVGYNLLLKVGMVGIKVQQGLLFVLDEFLSVVKFEILCDFLFQFVGQIRVIFFNDEVLVGSYCVDLFNQDVGGMLFMAGNGV